VKEGQRHHRWRGLSASIYTKHGGGGGGEIEAASCE
jgi:hypothetical protein